MSDTMESFIRLVAYYFPGVKLETQGGWRIIRQANEEERRRWGW